MMKKMKSLQKKMERYDAFQQVLMENNKKMSNIALKDRNCDKKKDKK